MSHKTMIDGVAYEISGGKTLIDGTAYSIKNGKTLVGGTAYEVGFTNECVVTINSRINSGYSSVSMLGETFVSKKNYTEERIVPPGTKIICEQQPTYMLVGEIVLNGTVVATAQKGYASNAVIYEYTVNRDVTIEMNGEAMKRVYMKITEK